MPRCNPLSLWLGLIVWNELSAVDDDKEEIESAMLKCDWVSQVTSTQTSLRLARELQTWQFPRYYAGFFCLTIMLKFMPAKFVKPYLCPGITTNAVSKACVHTTNDAKVPHPHDRSLSCTRKLSNAGHYACVGARLYKNPFVVVAHKFNNR